MRRWLALAAATAVLGAWGCKDTVQPGAGDSPSNIVFPATNVSYTYHVQPLFNQACNFTGCHDSGVHQSPLKLTSRYDVVFGTGGVVILFKPDDSGLVWRIEGRVGFARMPPGDRPLNQNQINGIRTWIAEGAKDN